MNRRAFLAAAAAILPGSRSLAAEGDFEITRTEAEWRAMLSDAEYRVMRKEGTERAFTSPLNDEKRAGTFLCKGCDLPLYSSEHKFDSGTGWPSFTQALPDAIETKPDRVLIYVRTECHCRRCGSHLGHIFDDGPPPTGKRHCINGISLTFQPASA
ncbi:peptide-methionine (R)-S-oxide reductase MsrB [Pseudoponticoccus marisrubri]|uniref:peptide-methionine (R)-S-oxide reductase n=1 Tax=Pseudoponticoccus marisrubri TaxID=1685382 RepID=A0A0W7WMR8_9RHOB|nr:peptide-methionine (R)-S-oxide reductase MsrB [Pseudoponticoccus marisrubri]KUF11796.1 methionine sulfoxide reductase B [Pseudoponticoccus marisrubri]